MDLEVIIVSKSDGERQIYDTTYMRNLKRTKQMNLFTDRSRLTENNL